MKSYSVVRNFADTKLLDNKNNFEDIDEAQSDSRPTTPLKNVIEDKEQSNTELERDIIDISEIRGKGQLTKKKILENISFETTEYDIYNPQCSS